ncbi:hypothetical protein [Acetobacter oeni]|uniref:hypothetical protein n=1 Tax=Acetobacter oeni TaxID=304077 RepID=UPI0011BE829D|nr:hypothetical protein [Acetobacter oeni]MBB3883360.1 hypothetical protein [Acetobacter oeni]NHO19472.1 hypothetical protein [Acetobacter oeni]
MQQEQKTLLIIRRAGVRALERTSVNGAAGKGKASGAGLKKKPVTLENGAATQAKTSVTGVKRPDRTQEISLPESLHSQVRHQTETISKAGIWQENILGIICSVSRNDLTTS